MRNALFAVIGVTLLIACKKESAAPPSTDCGDRADAFEAALASPGAGTCANDGDCRCFPGGISKQHGCGGITDAKTGEKLASIASDYMKAGCKSGIDCAAWMCMPSCQNGKCTDAPPKVAATSPAPAPEGGRALTCEDRAADIDKLLAASSRRCQTNADCVCFRGGVAKKDPCGGITDVKTNQRFEALAKEWTAAGCKKEEVMCPAMVCQTTCNKGTCGPPSADAIIQ